MPKREMTEQQRKNLHQFRKSSFSLAYFCKKRAYANRVMGEHLNYVGFLEASRSYFKDGCRYERRLAFTFSDE